MLTKHAKLRKEQRGIPKYAIDLIKSGRAYKISGVKKYNKFSRLYLNHKSKSTTFNIVRVSEDEFIVGVQRQGVLVTIYSTDNLKGSIGNQASFEKIEKAKRLEVLNPGSKGYFLKPDGLSNRERKALAQKEKEKISKRIERQVQEGVERRKREREKYGLTLGGEQ